MRNKVDPETKPTKRVKIPWTGLLAAVLLTLFVSGVRVAAPIMTSESDLQQVESIPLLTGYDAYHFLSVAEEWEAGPTGKKFGMDPKRFFPEFLPYSGNFTDDWKGYGPSWVIAKIDSVTRVPLPELAYWAPALWAGLFVFPVVLYFWSIRLPWVGVVGSLFCAFSQQALLRMSAGRLDTDAGLLFFPSVSALLVLPLLNPKSHWFSLLLAGLFTGINALLLLWWYGKESLATLTVLPFCSLAFIHLIRIFFVRSGKRSTFRQALPLAVSGLIAIVVGASHSIPDVQKEVSSFFEARHVQESLSKEGAVEPNFLPDSKDPQEDGAEEVSNTTSMIDWSGQSVWETVEEAAPIANFRSFSSGVFPFPLIVALAVVGLLIFSIHRPIIVLPWIFFVALGFLFLAGGQRFLLFASLPLGLGLGYLVHLAISHASKILPLFLAQRIQGRKLPTALTWLSTSGLVLAWAVFLIASQRTILTPGPVISPQIAQALREAREKLPENAVILSWWDLGYAIRYFTDRAIFTDGATQFSLRTRLIASALASSDPEAPAIVAQALASLGEHEVNQIVQNRAFDRELLEDLKAHLKNADSPNDATLYLLLTNDLYTKLPAIHQIGSANLPDAPGGLAGLRLLDIKSINPREKALRLADGRTLFLETGKESGGGLFENVVLVRDGKVFAASNFPHKTGRHLAVLFRGNTIFSAVEISDAAYRTNFVQFFLLGRFSEESYHQTIGEFPLFRMLEIRKLSVSN